MNSRMNSIFAWTNFTMAELINTVTQQTSDVKLVKVISANTEVFGGDAWDGIDQYFSRTVLTAPANIFPFTT